LGEKEEYEDCYEKELNHFNTYDQYVDVVSCWEAFLEKSYSPYFDEYFFDRYPSLPIEEKENSLTPDFTVFFNEEYGLLFEMKRTFPQNKEAFDKELNQLEKYTHPLPFKSSGGSRITPSVHDVVLLVSSSKSFTIAKKINNRINNKEIELDTNLILLEYMYSEHDKTSGYQFRRVPMLEKNFQDSELPDEKRLSQKMEMKENEGYENIFIEPCDFVDKKVTGVLCNDKPPALYLVCYLWDKVFYNYLDKKQKERWSRKNPRNTFEIEIDLDNLQGELNNDYIPNGFIRMNWLKNAFKYLETATLAEKQESKVYKIKYRNLKRKRNKFRESKSEKTDFADLSRVLAEWYCQKEVKLEEKESQKEKTKDESKKEEQSSIFKFS